VNILFICSRNKWRSRTAETIYKKNKNHQVKSAGTESSARIRVNEKLLRWADMVFVMEKKHKERLIDSFNEIISNKELYVLDILDEYQYMDAELIAEIKDIVSTYLDDLN